MSMAAVAEEQAPFLGEVTESRPRAAWRRPAVALVAVAAACGAAAAYHSRAAGPAAWKRGNNLAFLAEQPKVDSVGVAAMRDYGNAMGKKVEKDLSAIKAIKETSKKDLSVAKAVLKLENSEVEAGKDQLDEAESMASESKTEASSAATIGKMSDRDTEAAKSLMDQAAGDMKAAKEIQDQANSDAAGVKTMAQQMFSNANATMARAKAQLGSAHDMEAKAKAMLEKSKDISTAELAMNKTALKEIGSEKAAIKLARTEIERASNLTKKAEELGDVLSKDRTKNASVIAETKKNTQDVLKANKDIKEAAHALAKALAAQQMAKVGLENASSMANMSAKEMGVVKTIEEQLDMQTKNFEPLGNMGVKTDDADKFGKISEMQSSAVEEAHDAAEKEKARAQELKEAAASLQAKEQDALSAAKADEQAANNKTADAKAVLKDINSKEHVHYAKDGELQTLKTLAVQDGEVAEAIAEAAQGLAGLLAESKSQARVESDLAESGQKEAGKLVPVAAKPLKDMVQDEQADAADKEKAATDGVQAVKDIAGLAKDMQVAAKDETEVAQSLAKKLGVMEATTTAKPDGKCCSYKDSGVCGTPNTYCDSAEDACTKCTGTYIARS